MDQRYVDLAAAIVRQAFHDAAAGYRGKGMEPRRWLELAGLVEPDGTSRYGAPSRGRSTPTNTDEYNMRRRLARADERWRREPQEV